MIYVDILLNRYLYPDMSWKKCFGIALIHELAMLVFTELFFIGFRYIAVRYYGAKEKDLTDLPFIFPYSIYSRFFRSLTKEA